MSDPFFMGIDVGTQGARVVLIDRAGDLVSTAQEDFAFNEATLVEQSPDEWWQATLRCLQELVENAKARVELSRVKAVAVTSTSGTVIPIDAQNRPLHPALMYSDKRPAKEGEWCRQLAIKFNPDGYTGFNSSSGLPKMLWFVNNFPAKAKAIHKWIHAADYITGMLSGTWGITDYTNALKSGYDLREMAWPEYVYKALPIQRSWLPDVVPPGRIIGSIRPEIALKLGLKESIQVVAGITDGCAAQIASGAVMPGQWNTTIGTTLVVKGVTVGEMKDPVGRLYNHRHPEGYWMPGGASNIGADWVTKNYQRELDSIVAEAARIIPTGKIAYPLQQVGERFPFIAPEARGFEVGILSRLERFAASMEGVAYVEKNAYELIEELSGEKVQAIYTAGGASNSDLWLTIRSSVLNLPIYKMRHVTGGMGAAILAASETYFGSLTKATAALTQIEKAIQPQSSLVEQYSLGYREFLGIMHEKGYIKK